MVTEQLPHQASCWCMHWSVAITHVPGKLCMRGRAEATLHCSLSGMAHHRHCRDRLCHMQCCAYAQLSHKGQLYWFLTAHLHSWMCQDCWMPGMKDLPHLSMLLMLVQSQQLADWPALWLSCPTLQERPWMLHFACNEDWMICRNAKPHYPDSSVMLVG